MLRRTRWRIGGGADCTPINGLVGALSVLCPGPDSNRAAAGLARVLRDHEVEVLEVNRPDSGNAPQAHVLTLPRLTGRNQRRIDYRHLIWSLVRKPGAFAAYCYRDELSPTTTFRRAYDALLAATPTKADCIWPRAHRRRKSTKQSAA